MALTLNITIQLQIKKEYLWEKFLHGNQNLYKKLRKLEIFL